MSHVTGKVFLAYLCFVLLISSVANLLLVRFLEGLLLTNARQSLQEKWVESYPSIQGWKISAEQPDRLHPRLEALAQEGTYRLSLFDLKGRPVADSKDSNFAGVGSVRLPPEVEQALESGQAFALREPGQQGAPSLAFAKPTEDAVLRVSTSTEGIYSLLSRVRFFIWTATLVLLGLSWLFYLTLVRRADAALFRFKKMVKGFEQGDYHQRFPVARDDEVGEIGQSMNSLARELERKIRDLAEERNRLKTILDAMQEGVIVINAGGNISLFNPAMRQLFGLKETHLGRPPIEVIRNADLQSIVEECLQGRSVAKREIRVLNEGRECFLMIQATSFRENSDETGAIVVMYDITNLRRLERVRRDFVANVSHELKTPLTSIRGYVETLLDGGLDSPERSKNFLGIIDTNTRRLGKLVEDLLRLSEIESQQFVLKPEHFRVQELFGEVLDLHDALLKRKGMSVDVRIQPESLALEADRLALLHLLNNLIENAIKYGHADTAIQLECRAEGETAVFRVRDRGIGIAKPHLERIFERFYRVDKSRSKQEGGTGLGLAIVKHLVQLMGGEIAVESEEEKGTAFIVRLPRAVALQLSESLAK